MTIEDVLTARMAAAVEPLVVELRAMRAAVERLEVAGRSEFIDGPALAGMLGLTGAALRMRLHRGSDLAGIARIVDGRRLWARRDVEVLLARSDGPATIQRRQRAP